MKNKISTQRRKGAEKSICENLCSSVAHFFRSLFARPANVKVKMKELF